jgi:chaperonin cofactor prefoldin
MPVLETFNISVTTFKTDTNSNLALGFKSHLFRIYAKKNKTDALQLVDNASEEIAKLNLPDDETKGNTIMKKSADKIAESLSKPLFRLEIAAAYLGSSTSNSFKSLAATKAGAWLNASYSPYGSDFAITALSRYSWAVGSNPKTGTDSSFLDFGLSASYKKNKVDLAIEFLNRKDFSLKEYYNRLAFVINYEISDEITLVSSLGRNFTDVNNIFSILGVKFGISQKKKSL